MLKSTISNYILQTLSFDAVGFTSPYLGEHLDRYRQLVAENRYGDLKYLSRHLSYKESPEQLLPGVKTAIVVVKSYKNTQERFLQGPEKRARFSLGQDYHTILGKRLELLDIFLKDLVVNTNNYWGVDSKPIPERSLAIAAGLGFIGKNQLLIRPGLGSYIIIGVMYTTLFIEPFDSPLNQICGGCDACINTCPVQALNSETGLTITDCLSYITLSRKTPMTAEEKLKSQGWVFGCDACQEICPYNVNTPLTNWPEFCLG